MIPPMAGLELPEGLTESVGMTWRGREGLQTCHIEQRWECCFEDESVNSGGIKGKEVWAAKDGT